MILHITTRSQWERAILLGIYHDSSLENESFIHCSTQQQILRSANEHYRGQSDELAGQWCISCFTVLDPYNSLAEIR